jgi:hypothetical protein
MSGVNVSAGIGNEANLGTLKNSGDSVNISMRGTNIAGGGEACLSAVVSGVRCNSLGMPMFSP